MSKPHLLCIQEICNRFEQYKEQILFRFTVGSANSDILKFWEQGAPSFEERLECLKHAFEKGFKTSVSCEPMLDDNVSELVDKALPYVTDAIWIGKANDLIRRMKINGVADSASLMKAKELVTWQSNDTNILDIYQHYKDNPKIKWKESIKKVVKIEIPKQIGLDI